MLWSFGFYIWGILWRILPILVCCAKKNLATLMRTTDWLCCSSDSVTSTGSKCHKKEVCFGGFARFTFWRNAISAEKVFGHFFRNQHFSRKVFGHFLGIKISAENIFGHFLGIKISAYIEDFRTIFLGFNISA
jgi:hypothetical protein